ncbi:MAG: hypothetical protein AAF914_11505 [Pseudomonadota bacterium]
MSRRTKPWRQRGILTLLAAAFLASGLLRLGGLNLAVADTDAEDMAAPDAPATPQTEAALATALQAVTARAAELDRREAEIADRQARLDVAAAAVSERLAALEEAEARLSALLTLADTAAADDIAQLVTLYETMAAEEAAALFAEMDPAFAAGFISRMRPEAGAALLSEIEPSLAYAISVILATRNADVPAATPPDTTQ